jgi:signal transduction histidine kinase
VVAVRKRRVDSGARQIPEASFDIAESELGPSGSEVDQAFLRAMLARGLDAWPGRVAILDTDGGVLLANRVWRKAQLADQGTNYLDTCETPALRTLVKRVLDGRSRHASLRHCGVEQDTRKQYRTQVVRMDHHGTAWILISHEDITESESVRRAFVALADQLTNLQEQERQRIARELHDSTAQHLAIVALQLARLSQASSFSPAGKRIMAEISALLHQAQDELRTFTYLLHPPELDGQGFKAAVESLVAGFSERAGLQHRCRIAAAVDLASNEIQRSVFRVLQEALTNVYRHARARRILVLITVDEEIRLYIKDDGRGLSNRASPEGRVTFGVGVLGMQARMHLLGGTVEVRNANRGTVVSAVAPFQPDRGGEQDARRADHGRLVPASRLPADAVAVANVRRIQQR